MKAGSRISRILILAFLLWLAASSAMPGSRGLASIQAGTTGLAQPVAGTVAQGTLQSEVENSLQEGFPESEVDAILGQIQAEEYFISWVDYTYLPGLEAAYQAPNRANGFRTYFTGDGAVIIPRLAEDSQSLAWRWYTRLGAWGRAGGDPASSAPPAMAQASAPDPLSVQQNRVEMRRNGITEWYINADRGLQQGFEIAAAPQASAGAMLQIELLVDTDLQAEQGSPGNGVVFSCADGACGLVYGIPKATGADGASLPVTTHWDGARLLLQVDDSQALYPLQVILNITDIGATPAWQLTDLPFSLYENAQVATAGDVNGDEFSDLIIGAPYYDSGGMSDRGAVWIYAGGRNLSSLSQLFFLEGLQEGALFGYSVSTAGDVNGDGYADVIVGAPMWDGADMQQNEGAIWIFHGGSTGINTTAERYIEGGQANANFGSSVSFAGDVNRDNYADVIVGAPGYTNTTVYGQGKVFVYHGSASGIGTTANWVAVNTGARASMGWSVAAAGDVNGDRYADVIVGAPEYPNGDKLNAGNAFVWHGSSSGVNGDVDGNPANSAWQYLYLGAGSKFGWSVSSAGDINGDSYSDVIVASPFWSLTDDEQQGWTSVFLGSSSGLDDFDQGWDHGVEPYDLFGYSVAFAGDVNGDGYGDMIVGAPGADNVYSQEGRAVIWYGHTPWVDQNTDWFAWGGNDGIRFGSVVATAGDINGDGYSEVIIVANPGDEHDLGLIRMYAGGPQATQETASWNKQGNQEDMYFGFAVNSAGDVNGDGFSDIIIGAPHYDNGQPNEGVIFIYQGTESGPQSSGYYFMKESDLAGAQFGFSVASAGDVDRDGYDDVIVGAPYWEQGVGGADEGGAWVYRGTSTGMVSTPYWYKESDQAGALFGWSVAGAGDTNGDGYAEVIIGAPLAENDIDDDGEGMAFVYRGSAGGIISTPYFSKDADQAGAHFGASVASAGDVNRDGYADLIVGAPNYTGGYSQEGGAWVYLGGADKINPTPAWYTRSNQANAHLGYSVASAGDVNGDGYSDVIVGAPDYDKTEIGEGLVRVYLGNAGGVSSTAIWEHGTNRPDGFYGCSVSSAGDVNGDGYADIVVGAYSITESVADDGGAYVYLGSASGNLSFTWVGAGGETLSGYGYSVAGAGDINGDGYDDILVGAPYWGAADTNPPGNRGRVWVYHGGGGVGESLVPRQLNADDSPIAHLGMTANPIFFGLHLQGKSPFGSSRMGMITEVDTLGNLLDGFDALYTPYASTSFAADKFAWYFVNPGTVYHWRARLRFDPVTQPYLPATRWLSMPYHGWNESDLRTMYLYTYLPVIVRE